MQQDNDVPAAAPYKRLPAALVFTFLMQGSGILVWATHLEARVSSVEQQSVNAVMLNEKFARLDERLAYVKQGIEDVRAQLQLINKHLMDGR